MWPIVHSPNINNNNKSEAQKMCYKCSKRKARHQLNLFFEQKNSVVGKERCSYLQQPIVNMYTSVKFIQPISQSQKIFLARFFVLSPITIDIGSPKWLVQQSQSDKDLGPVIQYFLKIRDSGGFFLSPLLSKYLDLLTECQPLIQILYLCT